MKTIAQQTTTRGTSTEDEEREGGEPQEEEILENKEEQTPVQESHPELEQEVDPELGPPREGEGEMNLTGEQAVRFLARAHQLDSIVRGSYFTSGYVSKEPAEILLDEGSEITLLAPPY